MKLGCFGSSGQIEAIQAAGFDSAELDLCEIAAMSPQEFSALRRRAQASTLGFEVFSGLLPLSVRFHAPDFDEAHWLGHVEGAARRAAELGCTMIPLGAGKCRSIPQDCADIPAAKAHVVRLVQAISDILAAHGIALAVEPLGPANSNYVNTIPDAAAFVAAVARPNCVTMCDLRHMYKLNEDFHHISDHISLIRHAHIDYPRGSARLFPQKTDGYDYRPYLAALNAAGYQRLLTIEATDYTDFPAQAASSAAYLRELLEK